MEEKNTEGNSGAAISNPVAHTKTRELKVNAVENGLLSVEGETTKCVVPKAEISASVITSHAGSSSSLSNGETDETLKALNALKGLGAGHQVDFSFEIASLLQELSRPGINGP